MLRAFEPPGDGAGGRSLVASRRSASGDRRSAIADRRSASGDRSLAIGCRRSAIVRRRKLLVACWSWPPSARSTLGRGRRIFFPSRSAREKSNRAANGDRRSKLGDRRSSHMTLAKHIKLNTNRGQFWTVIIFGPGHKKTKFS